MYQIHKDIHALVAEARICLAARHAIRARRRLVGAVKRIDTALGGKPHFVGDVGSDGPQDHLLKDPLMKTLNDDLEPLLREITACVTNDDLSGARDRLMQCVQRIDEPPGRGGQTEEEETEDLVGGEADGDSGEAAAPRRRRRG